MHQEAVYNIKANRAGLLAGQVQNSKSPYNFSMQPSHLRLGHGV